MEMSTVIDINGMNINEYLDSAKEKLNLTSDYALSVEMGLTRAAISNYRINKGKPDEYTAFKLAEILEIDAKEIIVDLKSQSEKNEKKREFWVSQVAEFAKSKIKGGLAKLRIIHIM